MRLRGAQSRYCPGALGKFGQDLFRAAFQVIHGFRHLRLRLAARAARRQQAQQDARQRSRADAGEKKQAEAGGRWF